MRKLLLFLLLFSMPLFGQVVQYGCVTEVGEEGKPLSNVAITIPSVHDCQPTVSDSQGRFRLCFGEHRFGDVIQGIEVKKQDYDVVNVHLTQSWTLATSDTLHIIMAPIGKVKDARLRYYGLSLWRDRNSLGSVENLCVIEVESQLFSFNIGGFGEGEKLSDVDTDIPTTNVVNDKMFVVIVANQEYQREQEVPFALRDGEVFRDYCRYTLGIPEMNIHLVGNATLNQMRYEVDWLKGALKAYHGEAQGIFYYSGHGIPDETSRSAFLMPVDGYGENLKSSYSIDELYDELGDANADVVFYFIDACFSGATRDGGMMAESRGVAINSKEGVLKGHAVAFTAAQGNETAYAYDEKSHGLFTYYLLKKLKETQGEVRLGDLADYINKNVARSSALENAKSQHPTAAGTIESWNEMKLKKE